MRISRQKFRTFFAMFVSRPILYTAKQTRRFPTSERIITSENMTVSETTVAVFLFSRPWVILLLFPLALDIFCVMFIIFLPL